MKTAFLTAEEYQTQYHDADTSADDVSYEELERDAEALDSRIREALLAMGLEEEEDFMLMDEWQENFQHSGGIYTEKAHKPETLEAILGAIAKSAYPDRWYFHVACEAAEDFEGAEDMGELFIHNGVVHFDSESSSIHRLFIKGPSQC